jgi:hypothetical protein
MQRTVSIGQPSGTGKVLKVTYSADDMEALMGGSPKLGEQLQKTQHTTGSTFKVAGGSKHTAELPLHVATKTLDLQGSGTDHKQHLGSDQHFIYQI